MQTNRRSFVFSLLAGGVCVAMRPAALFAKDKKEDEWEKLGERTVDKREDHDVIEVKGKEKYTAIRFRVEEGEIEIDHVRVIFENDKSFSPDLKLVFREGERSRDIDLPGEKRSIKEIRFDYRSVGKGKAVISVRGRAA